MKTTAIIVLSYAAIVFFGGLTGCFLAHSIPSLVAGVAFGFLIAFNGIKILRGNVKGITLALIQSILLGSFFVYRLKTSGKLFPAVIMIGLSFLLAIYLLKVHPKEAPSE